MDLFPDDTPPPPASSETLTDRLHLWVMRWVPRVQQEAAVKHLDAILAERHLA